MREMLKWRQQQAIKYMNWSPGEGPGAGYRVNENTRIYDICEIR